MKVRLYFLPSWKCIILQSKRRWSQHHMLNIAIDLTNILFCMTSYTKLWVIWSFWDQFRSIFGKGVSRKNAFDIYWPLGCVTSNYDFYQIRHTEWVKWSEAFLTLYRFYVRNLEYMKNYLLSYVCTYLLKYLLTIVESNIGWK